MELTTTEQSALDESVAAVNRATAELWDVALATQRKRGEVVRLAEACRTTVATVLRLRGLDPDSFEAEVDVDGRVTIRPKTPQPAAVL